MSSGVDIPVALLFVLAAAAGTTDSGTTATHQVAAVSEAQTHALPVGDDPYLFSEQAWLEAVRSAKSDGPVRAYSGRVFCTTTGRFYVPAIAERQAVLKMRRDPVTAAAVADAFAHANAERLKAALGRPASPGDLLAAHLLGSSAAIRLLHAVARTPEKPVAEVVPETTGLDSRLMSGERLRLMSTRRFLAFLSSLTGPASGEAKVASDSRRGEPAALKGAVLEASKMRASPTLQAAVSRLSD